MTIPPMKKEERLKFIKIFVASWLARKELYMNVLGIENLTEIVSAHKEYIEKRNKIDREYEKKLKNNGLSPIIYSASREGIHVWSINDVKLARNISVIESVIDNENYSKRLSIFHDSFEIFSLER